MAKDRLATIFLGVEADVKQAMKDLEKFNADVVKMAEKAKEKQKKLTDKFNEHEKKKLQESLGMQGRRSKWMDDYQKKIKEQIDLLKKLDSVQKDGDKRLAYEKKVLEALEHQKALQKAKMKDYTDFLKESAREHSRYADELSKRDRTPSLIENLSRGYQKGQIIGEKFHPQENRMQRASRSLNIAASAFTPTKGFAERQTDVFYRLQKIAYNLQAAFGTLAATIGDLVGGMMSLVAVAGQAATGLVAIGGAMASMMAGMMAAKIALGGVGAAVQQLWSGQNQYNKALRDAKKAFRDLRFEAEQAALSEQEAAIALEKAREEFARMQDLPPDSRMYREGRLALDQAELNYRMAKARTKDTQDQLKKGVVAPKDPFADLTKSQKVFAKYLLTLKPLVKELKESAASGFLPPLQRAIQSIVEKSLPTFNQALNTLGQGIGNASVSFAEAFTDDTNLKAISQFAKDSKENLESFGRSAGNAFGGVINLLVAAQPLTEKFTGWIEKTTENFEKMAVIGKNNGSIAQFLDPKAIETAGSGIDKHVVRTRSFWTELGKSGSTILTSLQNMIEAAFPKNGKGGGWVMLDFITQITTNFEKFTSSNAFGPWLNDTTENIVAAVTTIGDFLGIMVDLAGMPETKKFWETLQKATPFVKKMLEDGAKAGPQFADVIVKITEFLSLLSDSSALKSFFDTLAKITGVFNGILQLIKPILDKMGAWHGVVLAVIVVLVLLRKAAVIFMGMLAKLTRTVGTTTGAMINFSEKVTVAKAAMNSPNMGAGFTRLAKTEIPAASRAATRMRISIVNSLKGVTAGIGGVGKALIQMQAQMRNVRRADYMGTMAKNSDAVKDSIFKATEGMGNFKKRTAIAKAEMALLQKEMQQIAISQANLGKTATYTQLTSGPLGQKYGAAALGGRAAIGGRVMRYGGYAGAGVLGGLSAASDLSQNGATPGNVTSAVGGGLLAASGVLAMTGVGAPIALGVAAAGMIATAIGGMVQAEEEKKKTLEIAQADVRIMQQTNAENALAAVMQAANLNLGKGQEVIDKAMGYVEAARSAAREKTGVGVSKEVSEGILNSVLISSPEIAAAVAKNPALAGGIVKAGAQIGGARGLKFDPENIQASTEAITNQILTSFSSKVEAGITNPLKAATTELSKQYTGRVIRQDEFGQGAQETLTAKQSLAFTRESKQGGALQYSTTKGISETERGMSLVELQKEWAKEEDKTRKARLKSLVAEAYASVKLIASDLADKGTGAIKTNIKLPIAMNNTGDPNARTGVAPNFGRAQLDYWNSANVFGDRPAGIYSIAKPNKQEVALAKGDAGKLVDAATGMTNLSKVISGWTTDDGRLVTVVDRDPNDKIAPQLIVPAGLDPGQTKFLKELNIQLKTAWAAGG